MATRARDLNTELPKFEKAVTPTPTLTEAEPAPTDTAPEPASTPRVATLSAEPMRISVGHLAEALPPEALQRVTAYIEAIERLAQPRFSSMVRALDEIDATEMSIPWIYYGDRKVVPLERLHKILENKIGILEGSFLISFLRDVICVWEERGAEFEEDAIVWPAKLGHMTLGQSIAYWRRLNSVGDSRKRLTALGSILQEHAGPKTERPRI